MEPANNALEKTAAGSAAALGSNLPTEPPASARVAENAALENRVPENAVNVRRQLRFTHASGERPLDGYTIKRGIGIGGFGEVYFAISEAGKEVALKRIQRNLDIELRGVRQCLNLKHVNLIALWDIRTSADGDSWVVMEYVPGYSLRDLLQQHSRGLLEADVRHWFLSICAGVCYLHDRGIVHRDLKPGNIFYDNDEKIVKIGDYGLSKFISHSRGSGHTESVGTFHYMAPEIGRGVYGKGIDIYALGVMLYEMLTGQLPFDGESSHEIIMKHLTASPSLQSIPPAFRSVVETALAKDPDARFASVREMLLELPWEEARVAASMSVSPASNIPPAPGSDTPTRHHPEVDVVSSAGCELLDVLYIRDDGQMEMVARDGASHASKLPENVSLPVPARGLAGSPVQHSMANEPVARAVVSGTRGLWSWFRNAPLATPVKVLLAAAAGLTLLINSAWLLPVAVVLGLLYLVYFAIRSWTFRAEHAIPPAERKHQASRRQHEEQLRNGLTGQPWSDRTIELTGALTVATVCVIVVGLLAVSASGGWTLPTIETWARYAWLASTATFASWAVLISGKLWEGRTGDPWQRRFVMAGLGFATGALAFGLSQFLAIETGLPASTTEANELSLTSPVSFSQLGTMLVLFTVLFGGLRWWRLADPLRSTRLSLWSTGLCVVVAVILAAALNMDPAPPAMLALMIAVAVQVASRWLPNHERSRHLNGASV